MSQSQPCITTRFQNLVCRLNVLVRDQSPASKILDMSRDPWAAVDEPTDLTNPALASRTPAEVMVPFSHPANVCVVTGLCGLLVLVLKRTLSEIVSSSCSQ